VINRLNIIIVYLTSLICFSNDVQFLMSYQASPRLCDFYSVIFIFICFLQLIVLCVINIRRRYVERTGGIRLCVFGVNM